MKKIKAKAAETPEAFALLVDRAADWWRKHGDLPEAWNRRDVVGALLKRGAGDWDAMARRGLKVPARAKFVAENAA
jgi:hypothetical protein